MFSRVFYIQISKKGWLNAPFSQYAVELIGVIVAVNPKYYCQRCKMFLSGMDILA
jgi:hypothetical protein